jgi:hypothetical protein
MPWMIAQSIEWLAVLDIAIARAGRTLLPRPEPRSNGDILMIIHKKILEWQAAHPNITWIGWGIVWAIVLVLLFWPSRILR